jgi:outer membrane protein, multidrug efflux system
MHRRTVTLLVGAMLASGGCSLAPQYARPASPVPPALPTSTIATNAPNVADVRWQKYFADPCLQIFITQALANNRDLRVASLNIKRAQALFGVQFADQFPAVNVGASVSNQRVSDKASSTGNGYTLTTYSVALGTTSWEVDLFGRVSNLTTAAFETYLATAEATRATKLSLVASVAQAYLARAADADSLKLAKDTLETQQAALTLITKSRDFGIATDLDLNQVQSQVDAARADVARYTGLLAVDLNALQVLVGEAVRPDLLPAGQASVTPMTPVSAGVSSDVLLLRPDILSAEHQLQAAYANIGAARAAYFPRITLTAGVGISSASLSALLGAGTGMWSFAPQIVEPIFNAGATRAKVKVSQIDRDIAIARYEKGIQQAFAEVSNALTLRETLVNQREAQEALVKSLDATYRLSDARYKAGIDSYLSVLVAQRSLFSAQQAVVSVRLAEQQNLVTLYKVLGGM